MLKVVHERLGAMWVHESKLEEYEEAGFKLASPPKPVKAPEQPKKTAQKKTTKK